MEPEPLKALKPGLPEALQDLLDGALAKDASSRFDTIRGCRIGAIYALDEAEAAELENIGEAPGQRNE